MGNTDQSNSILKSYFVNHVSISYLLIKQAQKIKINKGVFYNIDNEK